MAPRVYLKLTFAFIAIVGAAAIGCSSSDTSTGPTTVKCQVSLALKQSAMDAGGGAGIVTVTTQQECAWTAASEASWITGVTPTSGQGSGEVRFNVAPNSNAAAREGSVVLNGSRVRLTQAGAGCDIVLSPSSQDVAAGGGSGNITVTTAAGCTWSAASNVAWLLVTSGANGAGNGTVGFSASANTTTARTGTVVIGGQPFVVTQPAPNAPVCQNTIQPGSIAIGSTAASTPVSIQAAANCSWTAAGNVGWLTVTGPSAGSGNGSVTIAAAANAGAARVGTATIAGQTFTVTQAGSCAASLAPPSAAVAVAGASGSTAVTVAAGCAWTATSNDSWITITGGASGNGNGTVQYSVAANGGGGRSGTVTIAGQTFTVTQAGSCVASFTPPSASAPAGGSSGTTDVTIAAGCAWTATPSASWITITAGASGSGNGTIEYTVAANTGNSRSGNITIGSQTFTITQASACSVSINPASQTVSSAGGTATSVTVTASSSCSWTATPSASWITITSGASGTGNGTVALSIAANTGPSRIGTVTIGGQVHTINQSSGCPYSINPTSLHTNKNQVTGRTVAVTTTAGCTWNAASNDSWLTITAGASGSGSGTVTYNIARNDTGDNRTGTLTIAGITFSVAQDK